MHSSSKNIRLFVILLLIFSVGLSSLYSYEENKDAQKSKKELASKDQKKDRAEEISKPAELEAVVPFFSFDLLKDSYLIIKIDFFEDLITEIYSSEPIYTSKYFKTLFCFVISPNAP
jgi:hypothetical protein